MRSSTSSAAAQRHIDDVSKRVTANDRGEKKPQS
jgi:hypothetical protein